MRAPGRMGGGGPGGGRGKEAKREQLEGRKKPKMGERKEGRDGTNRGEIRTDRTKEGREKHGRKMEKKIDKIVMGLASRGCNYLHVG